MDVMTGNRSPSDARRPSLLTLVGLTFALVVFSGVGDVAAVEVGSGSALIVEVSADRALPPINTERAVIIRLSRSVEALRIGAIRASSLSVVGGGPATRVHLGGAVVTDRGLEIDISGDVVLDGKAGAAGDARLESGGDLSISATGTLRFRDAARRSVVLLAHGGIELEGRESLDVSILGDTESRVVSRSDLVLRSGAPIRGDAHWIAGGHVRMEGLDGRPADLVSPEDPIVISTGDVSFGSYTGASLHVLAGGSIASGDITINGTGSAGTTIGPANSSTFNGTDTFADLASVIMSDSTPVVIDGSVRPTVDLRAGIDWTTFPGGAPDPAIQEIPGGSVGAVFAAPSSAAIGTGVISFSVPDGVVLLSNQYRPAGGLTGGIQSSSIAATGSSPGDNGGAVFVDAKGSADLNTIETASYHLTAGEPAGNGGPSA